MQLAEQGIIDIPPEYLHDSKIQNKNGFTVAMIYAKHGIIPPKQWIHDRFMRCQVQYDDKKIYKFYTVQNFLQENGIEVPEEWSYQPLNEYEDNEIILELRNKILPQIFYDITYQNNQGITAAMMLATHKIIPDKYLLHDQSIINQHGDTVASILTRVGIIPPKIWEHDPDMLFKQYIKKDNQYQIEYVTIYDILLKNRVPIPNHWYGEKYKEQQHNSQQMEQAIYGQVPKVIDNPNEQNLQGWTIAMILAYRNIKIPSQCYHDPKLRNKYGYRVIDIQISKNQNPQFEWYPSPKYQDKDGNTQALILAHDNIKIDEKYYHNPLIRNYKGFTVALFQAARGNIPDSHWEHNKFIRGKYNDQNRITRYFTVKNFLQANNIVVPEQWNYTNFVDKKENTEAMLQAYQGIIPDIQYIHNPLQSNMDDQTVALILIKQGILIPKIWIYDLDIQNSKHESIRNIAQQKGYVYSQVFTNNDQYDEKYWIRLNTSQASQR